MCAAEVRGRAVRRPRVASRRCRIPRGSATPARSSTRSGAEERSPVEELEATLRGDRRERPQRVLVPRPERARRRRRGRRPHRAVRRRSRRREGARAGRRVAGDRSLARVPRPDRDRRRRTARRVSSTAAARCPSASTTASEFGGLNISMTKLNGVTHNPWRHGRTTGGSSAGSVGGRRGRARAARDRRRRRRLDPHPRRLHGPARHEGHVRPHPAQPRRVLPPGTVVLGCLARSVRDAARYYDVCAATTPSIRRASPNRPAGKPSLGTHDLAGRRVAVIPGARRGDARARGRGARARRRPRR